MKIKTKLTTSIATVIGFLTYSVQGASVLINEYGSSNITATSSSQNPTAPFNSHVNTINGIGLSQTTGMGTHGSSTRQSWSSSNNGDASQEWIQWDLGAGYVLDSIHVWNYNDSSRFASGIKELDIYVSANSSDPGDPEGAGSANWTLWAEDVTLTVASGASTYTGVDLETDIAIALPTSSIRWVRFEVDGTYYGDFGTGGGSGTGHGNANQPSLGEIQFFAVPEPSSTALLGLGGLALIIRRRR